MYINVAAIYVEWIFVETH